MNENVSTPKNESSINKKKNYRQKRKNKPTEKNVILSKPLPKAYIEQKEKEIPMYDPYTGEPNPYYEELTGKKNPLTINKSVNVKKEQLKNLVPVNVEYGRKNRFFVLLPSKIGIEPFLINKITGPKIKHDYVKIFGFKTPIKKYSVEDVEIGFKFQMFKDTLKSLYAIANEGEFFDFTVEILDSTSTAYQTWNYYDCLIKEINVEGLSYNNDDFMNCTIKLEVDRYEIK
jgi:hypothetical protein